MNLCDIEVIERILKKHGFRFSKSLGQNFLIDSTVPYDIAYSCGVDKESYALEVGPGIGCLTKELSRVSKKVVSVEIDKALLPVLEETIGEYDNVSIVSGDVLKVDLDAIVKENFPDGDVHACANLPYYITTPVIAKLIESGLFKSITVMVQKEVATRMCAKEGTKDYGAFTLYVNYYTKPEILFDVEPSSFVPAPKVTSSVIRLECLEKPSVDVSDSKLFFRIIKSSFMQRRKTLLNSISSAYDGRFNKEQISEIIIEAGFEPSIRGERLSINDFAKLANISYNKLQNT